MTDIVQTSVLSLIANSGEFAGKRVQILGYVVSQMEVWGIFDSEADCRKGGFKRGIWLETYDTPYAQVNEAYAVVEGTYDATSCGHLGMWSGTIRNITSLERSLSNLA
ncbi:MAG TPA: hypothetical protein VER96_27965 [Polyangiaceae bacterium]|nr:hypothetical protein [Polyangiaceae bacterium]